MRCLEKETTYIASAIKCKVQSAICDLDEVVLNLLTLQVAGVHEICSTEFFGPRFLARIGVDSNNSARSHKLRSVDDTQADRATSEDSDSATS